MQRIPQYKGHIRKCRLLRPVLERSSCYRHVCYSQTDTADDLHFLPKLFIGIQFQYDPSAGTFLYLIFKINEGLGDSSWKHRVTMTSWDLHLA